MRKQQKLSAGLTLVEIVVVIAILLLVATLGLPAVQSARESARGVQCGNQVRMISLAILNYESTHRVFPSNFLGFVNGRFASDHSAYARILPFLDSSTSYINFSSLQFAFARHQELAAPPRGLVCPSDPIGVSESGGAASFRFNMGVSVWARGGGPFEAGRFVSASEVTDGLSNVVGVSERPIGSDREDLLWRNTVNIPGAVADALGVDPNRWRDMCTGLTSVGLGVDSSLGQYWNDGASLFYGHVRTPNAPAVDCGLGRGYSPRRGIITARSYHPGVVSCGMMDGRTTRVSASIDEQIWMAVGTRSDGEVGSLD